MPGRACRSYIVQIWTPIQCDKVASQRKYRRQIAILEAWPFVAAKQCMDSAAGRIPAEEALQNESAGQLSHLAPHPTLESGKRVDEAGRVTM
jgi:hypothetical protein